MSPAGNSGGPRELETRRAAGTNKTTNTLPDRHAGASTSVLASSSPKGRRCYSAPVEINRAEAASVLAAMLAPDTLEAVEMLAAATTAEVVIARLGKTYDVIGRCVLCSQPGWHSIGTAWWCGSCRGHGTLASLRETLALRKAFGGMHGRNA